MWNHVIQEHVKSAKLLPFNAAPENDSCHISHGASRFVSAVAATGPGQGSSTH